MSGRVNGRRVALVTGAAAGIGGASARRLARDGMAVAVLDLDTERCAETVASITSAGGEAIALGADISDRAEVNAAVAEARAQLGPVTVLVNNAGMSQFIPFLEMTDDHWDRMMRVNLTGAFVMSQVVLPDMIAAGWGRIINISSMAAQSGGLNMAHYAASKGGMFGLTKALAKEFGPAGITVNSIPPRFITGTIMSNASFQGGNQPKGFQSEIDAGPICRAGVPDDIADAVSWLAGEGAGFVTGQIIGVNGGRYI